MRILFYQHAAVLAGLSPALHWRTRYYLAGAGYAQLAVLELVDAKNTVKEIVRKSRMGSFEVSKMLYRLLSIKLVRRLVLPVAVCAPCAVRSRTRSAPVGRGDHELGTARVDAQP